MARDGLVLSIPHSGTHYTVWFLREVLGLDVVFQHFHPNSYNVVYETLRKLPEGVPIVVPRRLRNDVTNSWKHRGESQAELRACYAIKDMLYEDCTLNWVPMYLHSDPLMFLESLKSVTKAFGLDPEKFNLPSWSQAKKIRKGDYDLFRYVLDDAEEFKVPDFKTVELPVAQREFTLDQWVELCHQRSVDAGWWDVDVDDATADYLYATKIALIHSEVSEMLEGLRKGRHDDHLRDRMMEEVEAADIFIRLADYCGARNINLLGAVIEKLEYNAKRADHKPENRAKEGGKRI